MFTLVLCYSAGEQFSKDAQETVQSSYIPQIGSKISGGDIRYGTYLVAEVRQSVGDGVLSSTVYIELRESD